MKSGMIFKAPNQDMMEINGGQLNHIFLSNIQWLEILQIEIMISHDPYRIRGRNFVSVTVISCSLSVPWQL